MTAAVWMLPEMTKVLVIDDEPIRLLCRVNLEAEGMSVLEANDGPSGPRRLCRAARRDPARRDDAGLDGWAVAEVLLDGEETADIPIIFLTARAEFRDRARGLDIGGVDHITKPFNPVELAPLVRGVLHRLERGERDELRREKLTEPEPSWQKASPAPGAGEVRGDDGGAVVTEEGADAGADSDPVPPKPKQVRTVTRLSHERTMLGAFANVPAACRRGSRRRQSRARRSGPAAPRTICA